MLSAYQKTRIRVHREDEWRRAYKYFSKNKLPPDVDLFEVVRLGALVASHYRVVKQLRPFERKQRMNDILKKTNRVLRAATRRLKSKGQNASAQAHYEWYTGYALYKVFRYSETWPFYYRAHKHLSKSALFLLDFGRLAYNTGWFGKSEELFHEARKHMHTIPPEKQPLQVYRWLAKTARLSGRFDDELYLLRSLSSEIDKRVEKRRDAYSQDFTISKQFYDRRAARAYLDTKDPEKAWAHVKSAIDNCDNQTQLLLSQQGIEALVRIGHTEAAAEFAQKWSNRLGDPVPQARFLRLAGRPFSARRAYLLAAETEAKEAASPQTTDIARVAVYYDPNSEQSEAIEPPADAIVYWKYANTAFNNGLPEEGLNLSFRAAELALDEESPLFLASVLQTLHPIRNALSDKKRVDDLFSEAADSFKDNVFIQLQHGYHVLDTGVASVALQQLERACALAVEDERFKGSRAHECFLALAFARNGDVDRAIDLWDEVLPTCDSGYAPTVYGLAIKWAVSNERYPLALNWAEDFLKNEGDVSWTTIEARPIIEAAARAALELGRSTRAVELYEKLVTNHSHHAQEAQEDMDPSELRKQAGPFSMAAVAYAMAGDTKKAEARIRLARQFNSEHELIPAADAALALRKGKSGSAAHVLISSSPPDWLIATLGPTVADAAEATGYDSNGLESLRRSIDRATGTLPSLEKLIKQNSRTTASLDMARKEAEAAQQANSALQASFEELVEEIAAENERYKSIAEKKRKQVTELENKLAIALAKPDGTLADPIEASMLLKDLLSHITFARNSLERILALDDRSQRSVLRTLGIVQFDPGNLPVREKVINLGKGVTVYEVGFPGNGKDRGRLYFTGGGTRWTLEAVGTKKTQKQDINMLRRSVN